ncbi:MAG: stalk domain-containing protein [Clostridia bacterium]|nr:stalk domain-containing protein [Clostridia bacterium]
MKRNKKAMLAAGLIAGAAAMTGCTTATTPAATPTPEAAQKETVQPESTQETAASPESSASPEAGGEESPVPIRLTAGGQSVEAGAIYEQDMLLLPLVETAEALGWTAQSESVEEETQTRRTVVMEREESRITVEWTVSDNTTRQITWQRDGLLIPVDAKITTLDGRVYVPAAFFEEAMGAGVDAGEEAVDVATPEPKDTPPTQEQEGAEE